MSCEVDLSKVANLLRPVSQDVFRGMGKLCLSTNYLHKLNKAFEEIVAVNENSSFNSVEKGSGGNNSTIIRDVQFLWKLVKGTIALKISPDVMTEGLNEINIVRFINVKILEIHKIDIQHVYGIQRLRSQLLGLVCTHNLRKMGDILGECGGDNSHGNIWSELKMAAFTHNSLTSIDSSLELTPWLQSLDLSYNQISNVEFLGSLPNLKYLNLSYNNLDKVPRFKGQICTRLQVLILNNNFIEDLCGLQTLSTLVNLDLHQNCIYNQEALLNVSHLSALQCLNIQENSISLHPYHRTIISNYLHKNIVTTKFLLNGILLSKKEKLLVGSSYPSKSGNSNSLSHSSHSSDNSIEEIQERQRKIRDVIIEDFNEEGKKPTPNLTPSNSSAHLQIKKQIEQLRQEYGTSWLYQDSGRLIQDVLGLEKSTVLSSTPSDISIDSLYVRKDLLTSTESVASNQNFPTKITVNAEINVTSPQTSEDQLKVEKISEVNSDDTNNFVTAQEILSDEKEDFQTAVEEQSMLGNNRAESDISDLSGDEEILGEESIFFGRTIKDLSDPDCLIVVTNNNLSERDVNSKEKARWHLNVVLSCEKQEDNAVKLLFDTVRRDRKERIYFLEEPDEFIVAVNEKVANVKLPDHVMSYECMKCSQVFQITKIFGVLTEQVIICPKCESNMVVEKI